MMVDAFVQPKLDDPELMDYYGVLDRLDMPQTIFAGLQGLQICKRVSSGSTRPER